jgi:integrase
MVTLLRSRRAIKASMAFAMPFCKSTRNAVRPYIRVKQRNHPKATDRVFPKLHRQLFNNVLGELGLKLDRDGRRRTLYSLRHTYICLRLSDGADIYQIAKNCRTSVDLPPSNESTT